MSKNYRKPKYLQTKPGYVIEMPWVQTSGAPGSKYRWHNGAHAAVHFIMAGLMCRKKKVARDWLEAAKAQIEDAVKCIKGPRAKVPLSRQN